VRPFRRLVLLVLPALVAAGCGRAETPKAPEAGVADALDGIVAPCAEAHMVIAGGGPPDAVRRLDGQALPFARRLAAIARRDPSAVYLATSMAELLSTERATAAGCHLARTAERLR
jgi:hypothetical protein